MFWKRLVKSGAHEVEAPEEVAETCERSAKRLGRLVERQRGEVAAAEEAGDMAGEALAEAFADCAFFVLRAPAQASAAAIAEAVNDLSFAEDVDPQALASAQAELLSPRDRLAHELAWLPSCDAEFQQRACNAIAARDADALDALRFASSGLARLNLGAALLAARPKDAALLTALLNDLPRWVLHETHAAVDEARFAAGMRASDREHFDTAAYARRDAIARQVAEATATSREGRQTLAQAIADNAEAVKRADSMMLEAVIAAYARIVDPQLQQMQAKIAESIAELRERPGQPARLTAIITTMDLWSQLRLPLQRLEEARGLDDPLSAELFADIRDLGIHIANEHKLQTEALRLIKALKHAFASVPGVQHMIERDLPTVTANVSADWMEVLVTDIFQNFGKFCEELRALGFDRDSKGPRTSRLIACFDQWNEAQPQADGPFHIIHEIAIQVNNKRAAPALAIQMIEWLLEQRPPQSISNQMVQNMCKLQQRINDHKRNHF